MRRTILPTIAATLGLAGCTDSDISTIKDGRLDDFPEYTIEQAFDNRKACRSIEWDTYTDDRDRTIVEYRCYFKGIEDAYSDYAESIISQSETDSTENDINRYIESKKSSLPDAENSVHIAKENLDSMKGNEEIANEHDKRTRTAAAFFDRIRGKEVAYFQDHELSPPPTEIFDTLSTKFWRATANINNAIKLFRRQGDSSELEFRLADLLEDEQLYLDAISDSKKRLTKNNTESLKREFEQAQKELLNIEKTIEKSELDKKNHQAVQRETIEKSNKLLRWSSEAMAYEFYRWTITGKGSFTLLEGGLKFTPIHADELDGYTYTNIHAALLEVYGNQADSYLQYRNAIEGRDWLSLQ